MSQCYEYLIVTDKPLVGLGIVARAGDVLTAAGVEVTIYDGVLPSPTFELVELGLLLQRQHQCDSDARSAGFQ